MNFYILSNLLNSTELKILYKTLNLSNLINSKENNIFLKKFVNIRKYLYINEHVFKNTFQKNNGN